MADLEHELREINRNLKALVDGFFYPPDLLDYRKLKVPYEHKLEKLEKKLEHLEDTLVHNISGMMKAFVVMFCIGIIAILGTLRNWF